MIALIFSILFPRTARALLGLIGLVFLIVVIYFGSSFHRWQQGCAQHRGDAGYAAIEHCEDR